jgi:hypothetical protein
MKWRGMLTEPNDVMAPENSKLSSRRICVAGHDNSLCTSSTVDVSEGIPSPRGPHEVHFVPPGDVETLHLQISRKRESLHPGVVSWQWLHSLVYARGLE